MSKSLSPTQALTAQFYDWEIRGRGWLLAQTSVELEPPFHPFFGHYVQTEYVDDGKRHTWLSRVADAFFGREEPTLKAAYPQADYDIYPFADDIELVALFIAFSRNFKVRMESMEQLLVMSAHCKYPLSFEIVTTDTAIHTQLICRISDKAYLISQLKAYFPECSIHETPDAIEEIIDEQKPIYVADYGVLEEFMRPCAMATGFDHDPLIGFFGILEYLNPGERAVLQVLFSGTINTWSDSIMTAVSDGYKGSFFLDAPEMPSLAQEKISRPLYGATVRLLAQAHTLPDAKRLLEILNASLITATASKYNSLMPLPDSDYSLEARVTDIRFRESHRFGMLLNSRELMTLVHFPSASIASKKVLRELKKTKAAPSNIVGHSYTLGSNIHQGKEQTVSISPEQRLKHLHVIGATGTRKSSLLLHLINQDIVSGDGFAVLDPHGDLIDHILPLIPKERINDVLVLDPNDREYPISFNMLTAHSEIEKEVLASDLVALFRRFSTSWGDQMNSIFANAILAFLESNIGGTLSDLRKFLIEKDFRDRFLQTISDPDIVYYWHKEFPLLKGGSIAPILTRLDTFLRPKLIRNMVSQPKSVNFQSLMDGKKIILVKLSEGLIGAENSFLLGAFIVSKIQQAAMARQAMHSNTRTPFYLYIDEFQHFITPSMAHMLSGVRKYSVGLILAHQDMAQVSKHDPELASSLIANAGTRVCFRLGDTDAKRLAEGFSTFTVDDLQNLSPGDAIAKVNRSEDDFSLSAASLLPSLEPNYTEEVIASSRTQYASRIEYNQPPEADTPPVTASEPTPTPPAPEPVKARADAPETTRVQTQSQHRYYQTLIKKMAESNGYKASIEMPTPDGKGKVDVLLEKDGKTIAVEISVTTDPTWELHNIQKCLNANYTTVYACIPDPQTRKAVFRLVQQLQPKPDNVIVETPEHLIAYLQEQSAKESDTQPRMKGYRVKVQHSDISAQDASSKQSIIERIVRGQNRQKK